MEIAIPFVEEVETEQITFAIPSALDTIAGEAVITYTDENGAEQHMLIDFNEAFGGSAIARNADDENVVVINLGTKVAVKKVTISVTAVTDANGATNYVTVSEVSFLENIVPENPVTNQSMVTGLVAIAGDQTVDLKWNRSVNITGYNVYISDEYSTDLADYELAAEVIDEEVTIASFDGDKLTNGDTYYFVVTSTSGTWESAMSSIVSATPETVEIPTQVQSVVVKAGDESITVSYKAVKNAEWYNIYYKEEDEDEYIKTENIFGTSFTLTNLINDTTYDLFVTATNYLGEGEASHEYQATPTEEIIEDPGVPKTNMLPVSNIASARLLAPGNVADSYDGQFDASWLYDEDYETHWTAKQWYWSGAVEYVFEKAYEMDYLVCVLCSVNGISIFSCGLK